MGVGAVPPADIAAPAAEGHGQAQFGDDAEVLAVRIPGMDGVEGALELANRRVPPAGLRAQVGPGVYVSAPERVIEPE